MIDRSHPLALTQQARELGSAEVAFTIFLDK